MGIGKQGGARTRSNSGALNILGCGTCEAPKIGWAMESVYAAR